MKILGFFKRSYYKPSCKTKVCLNCATSQNHTFSLRNIGWWENITQTQALRDLNTVTQLPQHLSVFYYHYSEMLDINESPDFLPLKNFIIPSFMFALMENVGSILFD